MLAVCLYILSFGQSASSIYQNWGFMAAANHIRSPEAISYIPITQHAIKKGWYLFFGFSFLKKVTKTHTTTKTWLCISQTMSPQPLAQWGCGNSSMRWLGAGEHHLSVFAGISRSGPNVILQKQNKPKPQFPTEKKALWPLQTSLQTVSSPMVACKWFCIGLAAQRRCSPQLCASEGKNKSLFLGWEPMGWKPLIWAHNYIVICAVRDKEISGCRLFEKLSLKADRRRISLVELLYFLNEILNSKILFCFVFPWRWKSYGRLLSCSVQQESFSALLTPGIMQNMLWELQNHPFY